jgi:hypothetical protein
MSKFAEYEREIQTARARFANNRWTKAILEGQPAPEALERFLLYFCALGVQMTKPVESWISRAGARCEEIGLADLGKNLKKHAKAEAGHDVMFVNDARSIADRIRNRTGSGVDVDLLLATPATPGIDAYVKLHEDTISGTAPYAQLAIEYEIERVSTEFGAPFIRRCVEILGGDIQSCLTFVQDHVELDVGHTKFNANQLTRLLEQHPMFLGPLLNAGAKALDAYGRFLEDCLDLSAR